MLRWALLIFTSVEVLALDGDGSTKANVARFPQAELIDGCFYKNARYFSPFSQRTNATTIYECQKKCVSTSEIKCLYFGFWPSTGVCYLAPADAAFTAYLSEGAYTGPAVCPEIPTVCTEIPTAAYPAASPEMSKMAWPMHMTPPKLSCWPKDFIGKRYKSCPTMTVVEDTATGWPGKCLGLREVLVPYGETCQSWCEKQIACSVWQEVEQKNPKQTLCYQTFWSPGYNCYARILDNGTEDLSFKPVRAQRIMHGEVRVLKKLSFVHIDGLKNVFDENYFAKHDDGVQACRTICYSDLGCQWWTYSRARGCYVEDISYQALPVPLTTASFQVFAREAKEVLDGEYIQHQCKELGYAAISSTQEIPSYTPPTSATTTTITTTEVTEAEPTTHAAATTQGLFVRPSAPSPSAASELNKPGHAQSSEGVTHVTASVMGVGALVVKGIDLNLVPSSIRSDLSQRYAALIATNTGLSRADVLDVNNKDGQVTLEPWQTGAPIVRRLQTTEPGFKAVFKLSDKGEESFAAAQQALTSERFYMEVQAETSQMLKHTLAGGQTPKVEAVLRKAQPSDSQPANAPPQGTSHANAELWLFILGFILVALIIAVLIWLFMGASVKKVSFTKKAETKQGQFRKLGDEEEPEYGQVSKAKKKDAAQSPTRRQIEEAEMRAVQLASRLSEEVDEVRPLDASSLQSGGSCAPDGFSTECLANRQRVT
ncbi:unnamed protein product [Durusdinium trenchii]|uniref:Apple domain-containing protein n=1 Tax=Durusdinium trenchii TaxID=1381693 RepID=A0ABP0SGE9_9DINO